MELVGGLAIVVNVNLLTGLTKEGSISIRLVDGELRCTFCALNCEQLRYSVEAHPDVRRYIRETSLSIRDVSVCSLRL